MLGNEEDVYTDKNIIVGKDPFWYDEFNRHTSTVYQKHQRHHTHHTRQNAPICSAFDSHIVHYDWFYLCRYKMGKGKIEESIRGTKSIDEFINEKNYYPMIAPYMPNSVSKLSGFSVPSVAWAGLWKIKYPSIDGGWIRSIKIHAERSWADIACNFIKKSWKLIKASAVYSAYSRYLECCRNVQTVYIIATAVALRFQHKAVKNKKIIILKSRWKAFNLQNDRTARN